MAILQKRKARISRQSILNAFGVVERTLMKRRQRWGWGLLCGQRNGEKESLLAYRGRIG